MSEFHHEVARAIETTGRLSRRIFSRWPPAKDAIFMNIVYGRARQARGMASGLRNNASKAKVINRHYRENLKHVRV